MRMAQSRVAGWQSDGFAGVTLGVIAGTIRCPRMKFEI